MEWKVPAVFASNEMPNFRNQTGRRWVPLENIPRLRSCANCQISESDCILYQDETCWIVLDNPNLRSFRVVPKQHLTDLAFREHICSIEVMRIYNWFSGMICKLFHAQEVKLETNEIVGHVQLCGIPKFGDDASCPSFESLDLAKRAVLDKVLQERVQ
jgi:hypothetical protein